MSIDDKIPCTEEDSPFFGKNYDSLMDSQKRIHDLYTQGKVSHLSAEKTVSIQEKTYSRMIDYKQVYAKKENASYINARKVILNS